MNQVIIQKQHGKIKLYDGKRTEEGHIPLVKC